MPVLGFPIMHLSFKHKIKNENWKQQLYYGDCASSIIFPFIGKDVVQLWEPCDFTQEVSNTSVVWPSTVDEIFQIFVPSTFGKQASALLHLHFYCFGPPIIRFHNVEHCLQQWRRNNWISTDLKIAGSELLWAIGHSLYSTSIMTQRFHLTILCFNWCFNIRVLMDNFAFKSNLGRVSQQPPYNSQ